MSLHGVIMDLMVALFEKFFLVFARISGIFVLTPIFGSLNVHPRIKAGLALFIAISVFPVVHSFLPPMPDEIGKYAILVFSEVAIGLIIGFVATLSITAFQVSGELYSVPMGLGIANTIDPLSQIEQPIIGQLIALFALLLFIAIGGPQMIILSLCKSYEILPLLGLDSCRILAEQITGFFAAMFLTGLKIGMPVIAVLFLVTLSMGLLAKTAPMLNILTLGWAITIVIGILTLSIIMPVLSSVSLHIFEQLFMDIDNLFFLLNKGR